MSDRNVQSGIHCAVNVYLSSHNNLGRYCNFLALASYEKKWLEWFCWHCETRACWLLGSFELVCGLTECWLLPAVCSKVHTFVLAILQCPRFFLFAHFAAAICWCEDAPVRRVAGCMLPSIHGLHLRCQTLPSIWPIGQHASIECRCFFWIIEAAMRNIFLYDLCRVSVTLEPAAGLQYEKSLYFSCPDGSRPLAVSGKIAHRQYRKSS